MDNVRIVEPGQNDGDEDYNEAKKRRAKAIHDLEQGRAPTMLATSASRLPQTST